MYILYYVNVNCGVRKHEIIWSATRECRQEIVEHTRKKLEWNVGEDDKEQ